MVNNQYNIKLTLNELRILENLVTECMQDEPITSALPGGPTEELFILVKKIYAVIEDPHLHF